MAAPEHETRSIIDAESHPGTGAGVHLTQSASTQRYSLGDDFHSLDLRVDKKWTYRGGSSIAVYLDVLNTYNHRLPSMSISSDSRFGI